MIAPMCSGVVVDGSGPQTNVAWARTYRRGDGSMYRNSRGLARLKHETARKTIERRAHDAVLTLTANGVPAQHADWFYDLRRKRLNVYGGLLRFIDAEIAAGKANAEVKRMVAWLFDYIDEECPPRPPTPQLKLVA